MLLEVKNITVLYSKAKAIENVSLNINDGETVSIIGANGAGKTTILRTISGLKRPASGEIWFGNKRIDRLAPFAISNLGIAHIPEGRMIFGPMTVLDNLKMGACSRRDKKKVKEDMENIFYHFPILKKRKTQLGGQLSGGEQQMLAIGRALMSNPKLLLMDEPSTGLSPIMVSEIGNIIKEIIKGGISILLVEQNCRLALKLSKRAYILELGSVALEDNSEALALNDRIKKYYLGGL